MSRPCCVYAVAFVLAVGGGSRGFAGERRLSELFENPDQYHGTHVTVSGVITSVSARVSRTGDPYYAFDLSDSTRTVTVLGSGRPPCAVGLAARVSGTIEITKSAGRTRGTVNATEVTCRPAKPPAGAPP